jgi:serine protease AprX
MAANRPRREARPSRHFETTSVARSGAPSRRVRQYKVDQELTDRKRNNPESRTKVILTLVPGAQVPQQFRRFARADRKLNLINGVDLELPNRVIERLEARPEVFRVHYDRPVAAHNYKTNITIGAHVVRSSLEFDGKGVGVAVIDSGVTSWHNDLTRGSSTTAYPYGNQRVAKFVDFVNGETTPYDDYGHGSHVAGIIAGNGYDSSSQKSGVAPGAHLVVLKVLDANGNGSIGNVIAAMDWVATNGAAYNIRVVNLSIGARVNESYWTDPLTLAAKKLTDKGIVVVTAAGNFGRAVDGRQQFGSITAPGNAPWVLTVGASSTQGTTSRTDDVMADYSSAGPTKYDYLAKPDLVAPGTGTVSLSVPGSTMYSTKATALSNGTTAPNVYLSLSGTSMAAPVVAGTVATMFQANPNLTPNLVKAILQYTAQPYNGYKPLQQGAGFLNALGAVRLARFYQQNVVGSAMPRHQSWSRSVIWGNRLIRGGYLSPKANAWGSNVVWGAAKTAVSTGDNVVWGTTFDNVVWGSSNGDNVVWGTSGDDDNVVWGTDCGTNDCDNVVWGSSDGDNVVWGTADPGDNVVWGSNGEDNVVWGSNGDDNVVWGSSDGSVPDVQFNDSASEPVADIEAELSQPSADLFSLVGGL